MKNSIKAMLGLSALLLTAQMQAAKAEMKEETKSSFEQLMDVVNAGIQISGGVSKAKPAMETVAKTMKDSSKKVKELVAQIKTLNPKDTQYDAQRKQLVSQMVLTVIATFESFDAFFEVMGDKLLVPALKLLGVMGDVAAKTIDKPQLQKALRVTKNGQPVVDQQGKPMTMSTMVAEDMALLHEFINVFKTIMPALTNTKESVTPAAIEEVKKAAEKKAQEEAAKELDF